MCLITLAYQQHPQYPFILIANRDEFFARPSSAMTLWSDEADILAGRDLEQGGTWLGLHVGGKFSAVTNFRQPKKNTTENLLSRGQLITNYLLSEQDTPQHLQQLHPECHRYGPYNLLTADSSGIYFSNNQPNQRLHDKQTAYSKLRSGIYGLCNASLDTPWPKLTAAKQQLAELLENNNISMQSLGELLSDTVQVQENLLPDTGISHAWEKSLSSQFICLENYGTRAKTIILQDKEGYTKVSEVSYNQHGIFNSVEFELTLPVFGSL